MPTEIFFKWGFGRRVRKITQAATAGLEHLYDGLWNSVGLPPKTPPTVTTPPSIAGLTAVGSTLTLTPGVYAGNPTPTVSVINWFVGAGLQAGQNGTTFVIPGSALPGQSITARETVTNSEGQVFGTSNAIVVTA